MKRIHYVSLLTLAGILLVLASVMPAIFQPARIPDDKSPKEDVSPRTASYVDYLFTIGVTNVPGNDDDHFYLPNAVATNATGHVYVVDYGNSRVQVFNNAKVYQYSIGVSGVPGVDNAHLNYTCGVAVNSTGQVYVADTNNHRVQVFDKAGIYQYTIGTTGVSGSGPGQFNFPYGVAVNSTGHLYVTESNNHRVQVFDKAGIYQYTFGGPGSGNGQFNGPAGIAVNASGHVYVVDRQNDRVQVFDKAGIYQYTIGTGYGTGNYQFSQPRGVAVNATGHVYVVDTMNRRVQVFDNAGIYQYTIGTGFGGPGNDRFNSPEGIAVNSTGHLYVADTDYDRVQVFNNGTPISLTISINGGAVDTNNTIVTLTLSAHDATQMCFSNNDSTYTDWEAYGTSKVWTLDNVAGNRTVYFKAKNVHGNSSQATDTITYVQNPTGLSLLIDGGATETSSTSVTLTVSATGATQMCFSNNGSTYTTWDAYGTSKGWILAGGPGPKTVYFKARNSTYEASPVSAAITFILPPTGLSIIINGGATETNSTSVTLTLSATGATQMCFSNNGTTYTNWETYSTTKAWNLDGGPGSKTVYYNVRNSTINATTPVFATITYILPPTGLSISINSGDADTSSTSVTLTMSATGATQMCFSNNGTTYTTWETYSASKAWTLAGGPGPKIVYFKARNSTIEAAAPVSDTITYVLQPTGLSITINSGAADTSSTSVTLTLSATGATEMCFSNNGTTYTNWETYSFTKVWNLDGGPGPKTVYFNARNNTINATAPVFDTITYILPPTGLSILIDGGAVDTGSASVLLTVSATGATEMCFSNNGTTYTAWEAYGTSKAWTLDNVPGNRTVFFKARNGTIEAAAPVNDTITYVAPPSIILIINDGAADTDTRSVTLVIWAWSADEMCFSNDGTNWYGWEPLSTIKFWGLWGEPGLKTVHLKVRNKYFEGTTNDTITYTLPPTDLSIIINDGELETGSASVTLTLSATGAEEMCFSNDGAAWSAWEPYKSTREWVLSSTAGYKTVYFRARNGTIEAAEPDAANITYNPPADVPTWVILIAVIVGVGAVIYVLRRKSPGREVPPALGGERKTRIGLLKGKMSLLKGKILKQDARGAAAGDKKAEEKVVEVAMKPAPAPAPQPVPVPGPEKKVETPKPAPKPEPTTIPKPTPTPPPAGKVEAPKTATKPAKKTSKKAAKKPA